MRENASQLCVFVNNLSRLPGLLQVSLTDARRHTCAPLNAWQPWNSIYSYCRFRLLECSKCFYRLVKGSFWGKYCRLHPVTSAGWIHSYINVSHIVYLSFFPQMSLYLWKPISDSSRQKYAEKKTKKLLSHYNGYVLYIKIMT